ncbi:MAG: hypothetical protein KAJ62_10225 [Desulfobacteraceae bacterium]|nr:hypothetical protein [Desulfobacteraceae bacterium]
MDKQKFERCPNQVGAFSGITLDGKKVIAGPLNCNSLTCPVCQIRLKKRIFKRILHGGIGEDCTSKYGFKFLTATYGGKEKRQSAQLQLQIDNDKRKENEKLTLKEHIYNEMAFVFHKMIKALKKKYGNFHYFRVCEPHKDGIPHFHILFAGNAIIPKRILKSIEKLWCHKYGMGYVKINCVKFKNKKHAISYMLKYITKDIQKVGKWKRIFSASQNALVKIIKKDWLAIQVYIGAVNDTGIQETLLYNHGLTKEDIIQTQKQAPPSSKIPLEVMNRMLFQQLEKAY